MVRPFRTTQSKVWFVYGGGQQKGRGERFKGFSSFDAGSGRHSSSHWRRGKLSPSKSVFVIRQHLICDARESCSAEGLGRMWETRPHRKTSRMNSTSADGPRSCRQLVTAEVEQPGVRGNTAEAPTLAMPGRTKRTNYTKSPVCSRPDGDGWRCEKRWTGKQYLDTYKE